MEFGQNICVVMCPPSTWLLYRQILIGALAARTEYIACAEDDMLATPEHYLFRPPTNDTFYYSKGRWWLEKDSFRYRPNRIVMGTCIVNRELLIGALERRFAKFPNPPTTREEQTGWSEPGRYWWYWKLPKEKIAYFHEDTSTVIQVNHKCGLGGMRRSNESDTYADALPEWGNAMSLYEDLFVVQKNVTSEGILTCPSYQF